MAHDARDVTDIPGDEVTTLVVPDGGQVSCVAFSPSHLMDDGDRASATVAVGHNLSVTLFDANSGERVVSVVCQGRVSAVAFHPFAHVVAVGDRSGSVTLWCSRSGTKLDDHLNLFPVSAVTMSPITAMLAVATEDGRVLISDTQNKREVTRVEVRGRAHRIDSLAFSSCERLFAISCRSQGMCAAVANGSVHVYDMNGCCVASDLNAQHAGAITAVAFHPTSPLLAYTQMDRVVVWRINFSINEKESRELRSHDVEQEDITTAPDVKHACVSSCAGTIGSVKGDSRVARLSTRASPDVRYHHGVVWTSSRAQVGLCSLAWDTSMLIAARGMASVCVYDVGAATQSPSLSLEGLASTGGTLSFGTLGSNMTHGHDRRRQRVLAFGVSDAVTIVVAPREPRWMMATHSQWVAVCPGVGDAVMTVLLVAQRLAASASEDATREGAPHSAGGHDADGQTIPPLPIEMWCAVLSNFRVCDLGVD